MFSEPERTIAALLEDLGRLRYTVSRLQDEVRVLNANLQRVGEEVWMQPHRSLKDKVNEQDIRIAHLEALMKGQAKTPPSNTLLTPQAAWPSWESVHQEDFGGGHDSDGPYKEPSTDLLPSAAPPKEPPPRKAPPQMTRPMDHGHETGLPKEPPPKKAPPQIPRHLDPGASPITSQVRPHKAPPEYLRTTPLVVSSAPLRLDMAGQGDRSQASDSWDPMIMPNLSHEPSKPDGQLGE